MEQKNLTAEQWRRIAEKLAEYLDKGCDERPDCYGCSLPCSITVMCEKANVPRATKETWINQAKKELGYE